MSSRDNSREDDDAESGTADDDNDDDDEKWNSSSSGPIELQDGNDESLSENNGSVVIINRTQSGITQRKPLRSSIKLCPQDTKCPVNVVFSSNESGEESCGENDNIHDCKSNKEIDKASVMKRKSSAINEKGNEAHDFAKCQFLCSSLTNPSSFVGRQSMRLISDNSPAKTLPGFDKFHANSKKQLTRCSMRCSTPKRLTANGGIFESSKYDETRGRGFSSKGSKGHESNRSAVDGFQIDKILESKVGGERCGLANETPDLEKYQSVGTISDESHPFGRRKSVVISSDSFGEKSPSSPSGKKSITLCQLTSSESSSHSWKKVEVPTPRSSPTHSGTVVVCGVVPQRISPNAQPQSRSAGDHLTFPEPSSQSFGIRRSQQIGESSGRESESVRSVKLFYNGRDEKARNRIALRANPGNESCLSVGSRNGRMKR